VSRRGWLKQEGPHDGKSWRVHWYRRWEGGGGLDPPFSAPQHGFVTRLVIRAGVKITTLS